jgi:hypothetical protein
MPSGEPADRKSSRCDIGDRAGIWMPSPVRSGHSRSTIRCCIDELLQHPNAPYPRPYNDGGTLGYKMLDTENLHLSPLRTTIARYGLAEVGAGEGHRNLGGGCFREADRFLKNFAFLTFLFSVGIVTIRLLFEPLQWVSPATLSPLSPDHLSLVGFPLHAPQSALVPCLRQKEVSSPSPPKPFPSPISLTSSNHL